MPDHTRPRYWTQFIGPDGAWRKDPRSSQPMRPPGEDLAALRAGLGAEPGSVPKMWPFYTCEIDDWRARFDEVSDEQAAEHAALALFGLHQQGRDTPMHRAGVTVGAALRHLRNNDKFSEQAVDSRVAAAVTATSVPALLMRLRGLVTQLRTIDQPLDYDQLMADIDRWHNPDARQRVRRKWGLGYHVWASPSSADDAPSPA